MWYAAALSLVAVVLSYSGVWAIRRWAERRRILDVPNERSSHVRPTPLGGGLAIVVVTLAGLWLVALSPGGPGPDARLAVYTAGAALIAAVSWVDDLRSLPNRVRFAAQSAAAILALLAYGYWDSVALPFVGTVYLGWLGAPIAFLWIVGLTNAYNFMDGIDGIAGGQAVVAGLAWAVLAWPGGYPLAGAIGALVAASSLGFLGHNWPPARIFMGDVGSAFLGYTFAVLPVVTGRSDPSLILPGALLVWPFVADTAFTFLRRLRQGENVFAAHRSHLYQRLVIAGHSHRSVTLLYVGLAAAGAALGLAWHAETLGSSLAAIVVPAVLSLGLWVVVRRREREASRRSLGLVT